MTQTLQRANPFAHWGRLSEVKMRDKILPWFLAGGMALLIAYACHPVVQVLWLLLELLGLDFGLTPWMVSLAVLALLLPAAFLYTLRQNGHLGKLRFGFKTAGTILLLSIPLTVMNLILEARFGPEMTGERMFPLLLIGMIYSGYYGMVGLILLVIGFFLQKEERHGLSPSK